MVRLLQLHLILTMEPTETGQPATSKFLILAVAGTIVAALAAGAATYAYEKNLSDVAQSNLQGQVNALKSELAAAKATSSPTVPPTMQPTAPPTAIPSLTLEQLKNMSYLNMNQHQIKLVNGTATFVVRSGIGKDGAPYSEQGSLSLDGTGIAFGDLDGDGVSDAAVMLGENDAGTGYFYSLVAVVNRNGQPVILGYGGGDMGDRPAIQSTKIQGGIITVNALVQGPNDSASSPTLPKIFRYKLVGKQLVSQ